MDTGYRGRGKTNMEGGKRKEERKALKPVNLAILHFFPLSYAFFMGTNTNVQRKC